MKYTISDLRKQFPTEDACLAYIFQYRYGTGYKCPSCGKSSWHRVKKRKAWACAWCAYQIHPLAGTIFHKSDTPLSLWFFALYKFANSRNGVSAKELERDLGVTYKTAWRIASKIRSLMDTTDLKLWGNVEVDEAYLGKMKTPRSKAGVPKVLGMVQRGGHAKALLVHQVKASNAVPLIQSEVAEGSNLMTDSAAVFRGKKLAGYNHNAVNHSKGEYAFGPVHTNTVESLFSQIKRSLDGTYHRVSEKHLQSYLDEFSWRLSHSRSGLPLFPLLLRRLASR